MYTYIATNTQNGKFYIGSSINFQERKNAHLQSKRSYPFQNALRKNPDAFEWEVWNDNSENRELEQALLDMWYGKEQCYNLSPAVSVPPPYEWTEERRKARGERSRQKGTDHMRTPEAIEKMKESRRNNPTVYTEERRRQLSERMLGNSHKKGKKESEETCRKKSQAFTGLSKPNQSITMTGRKWWVRSDGARKFQVKSPGPEWQRGQKWKG